MKKKGFTLVELLAVIVVLAIIALIAIPIVLNSIEIARKNSAKASALGYIDAVEKYIVLQELRNEKIIEKNKTYQVSKEKYEETSMLNIFDKVKAENNEDSEIYLNKYIQIKGKMPSKGIVTIGSKGTVTNYTLVIEKYEVKYDSQSKKATVDKIGENKDTITPEVNLGTVVTTTNSITIPYTLTAGTSGATVSCQYGTAEGSETNNGSINDDNNTCTINNLTAGTTYYFKLTPTSGEGKTGDSKTGNAKVKACKATSGTGSNRGDQITCGSDVFYVLTNDGTNISMLAKYPLNSSKRQASSNISYIIWSNTSDAYQGSNVKTYVDAYTNYLKNTVKLSSANGRLMNKTEVGYFCDTKSASTCNSAPSWILSHHYYYDDGVTDGYCVGILSGQNKSIFCEGYYGGDSDEGASVRPVIVIPNSEL